MTRDADGAFSDRRSGQHLHNTLLSIDKAASPDHGQLSRRDRSDLQLRITDNGPGLDKLGGTQPTVGLGLRATQERLQTLYGKDHSCDVQSPSGGGVEISIRIPFHESGSKSGDNNADDNCGRRIIGSAERFKRPCHYSSLLSDSYLLIFVS